MSKITDMSIIVQIAISEVFQSGNFIHSRPFEARVKHVPKEYPVMQPGRELADEAISHLGWRRVEEYSDSER